MSKSTRKIDITMPMGPNDNKLVDTDQMPIEVGFQPVVEVDASGRKKSVTETSEDLEKLGLKNKSQIIRYLDSQNYTRSAIAGRLNIRYQFVRNVLTTELKRPAAVAATAVKND